ncbi:MAG: hypothetical protein ABFD92_07465 [Planctomycetaceae bacterium]|nr:hypothetical protein [Planctomycetaceae bacterium]
MTKRTKVFPGADERTPSRAQYFSWINNTWEGSTHAQTLVNLDYFRWLRDEFGMQLDIYAWDAGNLDTGGRGYWKDDAAFKRRYPRGLKPSVERAAEIGCRMGMWLGPDGFGDTPAQSKARRELLVGLCRDSHMALFKFDLACDGLRKDKQALLADTLARCRAYCPDLIVLNHRIDLGPATPHATTYLWEGAETYIDVHMCNKTTAPHHRAGALARGLPPKLGRLTEDHGVCLSSCMDRWDDDLILQAFNRCLILAPEIYANPWLLRDDEQPKLARIYNLHRRWREILVRGIVLPEDRYGPHAVSRGNGTTRLITLRNLTWQSRTYRLALDRSIGLTARGGVEVRLLHPHERVVGRFGRGASVAIEVEPFRACLVLASAETSDLIGVEGCDADIVRDLPGRPVEITLRGLPGAAAEVRIHPGSRTFTRAQLDSKGVTGAAAGRKFRVTFPGRRLKAPWHRKLADLQPQSIPADAEALYEATCFAADSDSLEVRSLRRAGPTRHAAVQKARDAFFDQPLFRSMGGWDRYLFDGDRKTAFGTGGTGYIPNIGPTSLRIDLGKPTRMDKMVIRLKSGAPAPAAKAECSADLKTWTPAPTKLAGSTLTITLPPKPLRYLRLERGNMVPWDAQGFFKGKPLPRGRWRASNLFAPYRCRPAQAAWSAEVTLAEAAPGSFLCIAMEGDHGRDGAWAAARVNGKPVGCPDRAVSFDSNIWEADFGLRQVASNYTYYLPVTPDMIGAKIEVIAMSLWLGRQNIRPQVWITSLEPTVSRTLRLE